MNLGVVIGAVAFKIVPHNNVLFVVLLFVCLMSTRTSRYAL